MPSIVSTDRSLLAMIPCSAMTTLSRVHDNRPRRASVAGRRRRDAYRRDTPSRRRITRFANATTSASWVIDDDGSAGGVELTEESKTSFVDALSSAPVGSSASTIAGLVTIARAIATRCCWPPESSFGRGCTRSVSPTCGERGERPTAAVASLQPSVEQRQLDVREGGRSRDQIEALEHEADLAVVGQLGAGQHRAHVDDRRGDSHPTSATSRQPMMFINVLLPLPDAPMIATYSPTPISRLTPRNARTSVSPSP